MQTEIEAKFPNINIAEIKAKLEKLGAKCIKPRRLMKRAVYGAHHRPEYNFTYARVRDEGDKVTMSLKIHTKDKKSIDSQKELCLVIDSYENGEAFLELMNMEDKMYQESYRETYILNDCEVEIEEWPFLNPYLEIEAPTKEKLEETSKLLEMDWNARTSEQVGDLYMEQYDSTWEEIKVGLTNSRFGGVNPYIK